jgi:hypothetical protein
MIINENYSQYSHRDSRRDKAIDEWQASIASLVCAASMTRCGISPVIQQTGDVLGMSPGTRKGRPL